MLIISVSRPIDHSISYAGGWNLEWHRVHAKYMGKFPISGIVELSRVKDGGGVSHHVVLDNPIIVYGAEHDRVIIDHDQIERVTSWSILGDVS